MRAILLGSGILFLFVAASCSQARSFGAVAVEGAFTAATAENTVKFELTAEVDTDRDGSPGQMLVAGATDFVRERSSLEMSFVDFSLEGASLDGVSVEFRIVDGVLYTKFGGEFGFGDGET